MQKELLCAVWGRLRRPRFASLVIRHYYNSMSNNINIIFLITLTLVRKFFLTIFKLFSPQTRKIWNLLAESIFNHRFKPSFNGLVASVKFIYFFFSQIINLCATYMFMHKLMLPVPSEPLVSVSCVQKVAIFDSI